MSNQEMPAGVVLSEAESWTLLREAVVGRLAVIVDDRPGIFPVNHLVDHGSVVFRTAAGTKLAGGGGALGRLRGRRVRPSDGQRLECPGEG